MRENGHDPNAQLKDMLRCLVTLLTQAWRVPVCSTSGHVGVIAESQTLLHDQGRVTVGDAGYRDADNRLDGCG